MNCDSHRLRRRRDHGRDEILAINANTGIQRVATWMDARKLQLVP